MMYSCEYEFIEVPEVDLSQPVSFSSDIIPIFTTNNNCTACHRSGSQKPYLTEDVAYNSIVPALVNINQPDSSKIYIFPNPVSVEHGFKKYTQTEASLILAWIYQGAEKN